ncbi:MAG TPA: YerC/YecD family TrpR-related protein [Candidatus Paceibacterota bacterium]|nr:YerC/YecD family TrpR-related protein [Candidatus Paceibacterota bacterium]
MKVRPRKLKGSDRMRYLDTLYTAISSLGSREEVKNFLRDLLTESERVMMGRRIIIAQRLLEEKSYLEIKRELGVGIDTITRVHRWLEDDIDGYEKTVKKLEKIFESRQEKIDRAYVDPFSFAGLKKRYPLHFFLFNLFDDFNNKKNKK